MRKEPQDKIKEPKNSELHPLDNFTRHKERQRIADEKASKRKVIITGTGAQDLIKNSREKRYQPLDTVDTIDRFLNQKDIQNNMLDQSQNKYADGNYLEKMYDAYCQIRY